MKAINYKAIAILSLLVFVFLLGFSFSVQAYRISQQELNSPVSQYLRENCGVDSIEEYRAKLEQEAWLNISKQMEALATQYPEINFSQWRNPDHNTANSHNTNMDTHTHNNPHNCSVVHRQKKTLTLTFLRLNFSIRQHRIM
jgi:hypothetical protein